MQNTKFFQILAFILILITMVSCSSGTPSKGQEQADGRLKVVATTSIVGDVVSQVAGDAIELSVLLPPGSDPHSFDPSPQDIARLADAQVIFANGVGLESFLDDLIDSSGAEEKIVYLSEGIDLLETSENHDQENEVEGGTHANEGVDPHIWTDPNNVMVWVQTIGRELRELDPENEGVYRSNSDAYLAELKKLDQWIRTQVTQIPESERQIVSDHIIFSYFADQYGFKQMGAIIPGYSTLAEPSAQDLAALENIIQEQGVDVVLVGNTVNPSLAQRLTEDTGTQLIYVYTGSLSQAGGQADSYLEYIRYNVSAIVEALK